MCLCVIRGSLEWQYGVINRSRHLSPSPKPLQHSWRQEGGERLGGREGGGERQVERERGGGKEVKRGREVEMEGGGAREGAMERGGGVERQSWIRKEESVCVWGGGGGLLLCFQNRF